jgi:hypothetical protein
MSLQIIVAVVGGGTCRQGAFGPWRRSGRPPRRCGSDCFRTYRCGCIRVLRNRFPALLLYGIGHPLVDVVRQGRRRVRPGRGLNVHLRQHTLHVHRLLAQGVGGAIDFHHGAIVKGGAVGKQLAGMVALKDVDNGHGDEVAHLESMQTPRSGGLFLGIQCRVGGMVVQSARHDQGRKFIHPGPNDPVRRRNAITTPRDAHDRHGWISDEIQMIPARHERCVNTRRKE